MVIGLSAAWFFSTGSHQDAILAAGLFVICTIIDCVDGDIARALFKESRLGKWLDITADQVVHVSLFVAIAVGLSRAGSDAPVLALGASAALGAVISFAVVLRGMLRPEAGRSSHLARLIDAATSRDFAYPLLLLAVLDRLEIFLWLAAVGSHVFWILILALGAQPGGALASRTGGRTEGRERPREAHRPGSAVASRAEGKTEGAAS
jgi:phosphatidylglycerophosphate synthase